MRLRDHGEAVIEFICFKQMKRGEASLRSEASVKEAELAMPPASHQKNLITPGRQRRF